MNLKKEGLSNMPVQEAIFYSTAIGQFRRGIGMFANPNSEEPAFHLSWELHKADNEWLLPRFEEICLGLCFKVGRSKINGKTLVGNGVVFAGLDGGSLIIDVASKEIRPFWNHIPILTLDLEKANNKIRLSRMVPKKEIKDMPVVLFDDIVRRGSSMECGSCLLQSLGATVFAGLSLFVIGDEWDSHPEPPVKWAYARIIQD